MFHIDSLAIETLRILKFVSLVHFWLAFTIVHCSRLSSKYSISISFVLNMASHIEQCLLYILGQPQCKMCHILAICVVDIEQLNIENGQPKIVKATAKKETRIKMIKEKRNDECFYGILLAHFYTNWNTNIQHPV